MFWSPLRLWQAPEALQTWISDFQTSRGDLDWDFFQLLALIVNQWIASTKVFGNKCFESHQPIKAHKSCSTCSGIALQGPMKL